MRNIFIILILSLFWSCTSCNSEKPVQDNDTVPDKDTVTEHDTDLTDTAPDSDMNDLDELPDKDTDTDVECLDLRYNENTLKTGFPFKDKDGKSTFCRPGCDTLTETDPQCVRNIWEWDNWEKYQEYLEAEKEDPGQLWERECYPWPCKLPDMKASTGGSLKSPCDKYITIGGFSVNSGAIWSHGLSDGVVGMHLTHSSCGRLVEYLPDKDEYITIGQSMGHVAFNKGRYITLARVTPTIFDDHNKAFAISILKNEDKYHYELIYDNKDHNAFFSRPPFVGKDWVLIQVCEGSDGACDVKYAKSDKWEWHSLNVGKVQEGNIVDDRLSFILHDGTADRQIYYCDMSKYPSSFKDCIKVTRPLEEGGFELGHSPRIDEDDKNRLVYFNYGTTTEIVEVKFEDGKTPVYKDIKVEHWTRPNKLKGDLMLYTSTFPENNSLMGCWYRFDKNKSYCPKIHDWSASMLFPTFTGKWQIYKGSVSYTLRDWECYCTETGVCPFEE